MTPMHMYALPETSALVLTVCIKKINKKSEIHKSATGTQLLHDNVHFLIIKEIDMCACC